MTRRTLCHFVVGFSIWGYIYNGFDTLSRAGKSMSGVRVWIQVRACCPDLSSEIRLAVAGLRV